MAGQQQYLSTDPNAGQPVQQSRYLSTDPAAGQQTAPPPAQPGMSDEQWALLPPAEKVRNILTWAGNAISSLTSMGPAGQQAMEHPGTTLALAAGPLALGAAGASAVPYLAPAARSVASALDNPLISGGLGAASGGYSGYRAGGMPGAAAGAAAGGLAGVAGGSRVARNLNRAANRIDPPTRPVNPNTVANARMVEGMSEAGATPPPLPASVTGERAAAPAGPVASPPAPPAPAAAPSAQGSAPTPQTPSGSAPVATNQPGIVRNPQTGLLEGASRPSLLPHPEGGVWSPQRVQSEIGLAAKRQGVVLTEPEVQQATQLVDGGRGVMPTEAVAQVKTQRAAAPPARPKLTQAEGAVYTKLRRSGKTHEQAIELIYAQRDLAKSLGTPSDATVQRSVADRNETGRWRDDEPGGHK